MKELRELLAALQISAIWLTVYMSEFDEITPSILKQVDKAIDTARKLITEEEAK